MGMSPSAYLFYGYDLKDWEDHENWERELKPDWLSEDIFEDHVLNHVLKIPRPDYPELLDRRDDATREALRTEGTEERAVWLAWKEKLDARTAAFKALNVDIDTYGYLEEPSYALRVLASVIGCDDYGSSSFDIASLVIQPEWNGQIEWMIKELDLQLPPGCDAPGWHITCSYG